MFDCSGFRFRYPNSSIKRTSSRARRFSRLLKPVDFRNPRRQRLQMQPFHREQLPRNRTDMFLVVALTVAHHCRAC